MFATLNEQTIAKTLQRVNYRNNPADSSNYTAINNVSIAHFKVIPNPTSKETVRIEFDSEISEVCDIILSDNKGIILSDTKQLMNAGTNQITVSGLKEPGIYYIKLTSNNFTKTQMVVKQ